MEVLNGYKETSIGVLPSDWEVKKLGNLIQIKSGESPSNFQLSSEKLKYPYLKVEDLNNCDKYQKESRYYSNDEFSIVQENSIIFPKRGAAIINNKVRINSVPVQMDSNLMALTVKVKDLDFEFLYYKISKEGLFKIADTSTIPQINNKHIEPYKIPLPPLPEQQKIAEILSAWDKAIELCQKTIEELRLRNKGLAQQLLSGKTKVKGFEDTVWKKEKLRNITKIVKGEQLNSITLESYGEYPSYSGGINPSGYTNKFNTEKNTIIISEGGNSCGFVNFIDVDFWSGGHCYSLPNASLSKHIDKKFLFYYLKNNENLIMNLRVGSGLPNVQKKDVENFQIAHPSLEGQKRIVSILDAAASELKQYEEKLQNLKLQKKGLMQQLLTGKVRTV